MRYTHAQIRNEYSRSIQKDGASEGFLNVFIFRRISIYVAWVMAELGFSPNMVSILSTLFKFTSACIFAFFQGGLVIAALVWVVAEVFDMADGQVARLTSATSEKGAFLDIYFDRITVHVLYTALAFAAAHAYGSLWPFMVVLAQLLMADAVLYLDKFSVKYSVGASLDALRGSTNFLPLAKVRQYIKWDGGFTSVFLLSASVFGFPILLPAVVLVKDIALALVTFRKIWKKLS